MAKLAVKPEKSPKKKIEKEAGAVQKSLKKPKNKKVNKQSQKEKIIKAVLETEGTEKKQNRKKQRKNKQENKAPQNGAVKEEKEVKQKPKGQKRKRGGDNAKQSSEELQFDDSVFVAPIPAATTVSEITTIFSEFGEVKNVMLRKKAGSRKLPNPFCFVSFKSADSASKAIAKSGKLTIGEKEVDIRYRLNMQLKLNLLGNSNKTSESLMEYFKKFGKIAHVNFSGYCWQITCLDKETFDAILKAEHTIDGETAKIIKPNTEEDNAAKEHKEEKASKKKEKYLNMKKERALKKKDQAEAEKNEDEAEDENDEEEETEKEETQPKKKQKVANAKSDKKARKPKNKKAKKANA